MIVNEVGTARRLAASGQLFVNAGTTLGVLCTSGGTFTLREFDAAGEIIVSTVTAVAGQWYALPFAWANGCYVVIAGGFIGTFSYGQV